MPRSPVNDSTLRFSDRVENYVRYRPSYPLNLLAALVEQCGLSCESQVADVGAGTGIFSRLLLDQGLRVWAVEPNDAMRDAASSWLRDYDQFQSVPGQSEQTGMPEHSVDLVTAAQAFHWFDPGPTRAEFKRILKPGGSVALVWNERTLDTPFQRDYENVLVEFTEDYASINHTNVTQDDIAAFFDPGPVKELTFENTQVVDREGLRGRVESASYCPKPGTPGHPKIIAELNRLFDDHQRNDEVTLRYVTRLYLGSLDLETAS